MGRGVLQWRVLNKAALLFSRASVIFNSRMNRAFKSLGGEFTRWFYRRQMSGGAGIRIRRTGNVQKGSGRSRFFIPKKMRLAGFKGRIEYTGTIGRKKLFLRTGAPHLMMHERGGWIRPKRKPYLRARARTKKDFRKVEGSKGRKLKKLPAFFFVKRVFMKKRLKLVKSWRQFRSRAVQIVSKQVDEATRRAQEVGRV